MRRVVIDRILLFIFIISVLVILTSNILKFDIFEIKLSMHGPFKNEVVDISTNSLELDLRSFVPSSLIFSSGGDTLAEPFRSSLKAKINGIILNPPHSFRDVIRSIGSGAFSHWDDFLFFSLPPGIENNTSARLDVQYYVRLNNRLVNIITICCICSFLILTINLRKYEPINYIKFVSVISLGLARTQKSIMLIALICSILFLISIIFGLWFGYFLPNTAFFRWYPQLNVFAVQEPFIGQVVLLFALIGAVNSWFSREIGEKKAIIYEIQECLARGFCRYGSIFLASLFLYSVGATWAGIPRPQDLSDNAIAGLLPFSDANGHFQAVYYQVLEGKWDYFSSRRPLAAAFRDVLAMLVNYNNFYFLLLQCIGLSISTYIATCAVIKWRGIWSGLTFMALSYILVRPYLSTNLTEPLGIFWALISVTFFIRALRYNVLSDLVTGFHALFWALFTRMGSMFTLPAVVFWVVWTRWGNWNKLFRSIVIVGLIAIADVGIVAWLAELYGSKGGAVGSNFSLSLCGLAHGEDWTSCGKIYSEQLSHIENEAEQAKFYYSKAKENFVNHPDVFFHRIIDGYNIFFRDIWLKLLSGYKEISLESFPVRVWWFFVVTGLIHSLYNLSEKYEKSFWCSLILSVVASAPFVIFDDGWRVLSASFPMLLVLIASAFSVPTKNASAYKIQTTTFRVVNLCVFSSVMLLCIVIPYFSHRIDWLNFRQISKYVPMEHEEIFLGTSRMSGFLVLQDNQVLPRSVPSIHYSDFIKIIQNSVIEKYEPIVTPSPLPFALVSAISVNHKTTGLLIVPEKVFLSIDDKPWRFRYYPGKYWNTVIDANLLIEE